MVFCRWDAISAMLVNNKWKIGSEIKQNNNSLKLTDIGPSTVILIYYKFYIYLCLFMENFLSSKIFSEFIALIYLNIL